MTALLTGHEAPLTSDSGCYAQALGFQIIVAA